MNNQNKKMNLSNIFLQSDFDASSPLYHYNNKVIDRGELNSQVRSMASHFQDMLSPEDRVIICLNDSPTLIVSFLACIAVGAIPTVINPKATNSMLENIIQNNAPKYIIADFLKASSFPHWEDVEFLIAYDLDTALFDDLGLEEGNAQWDNFYQQAPDDLCYLQYTSGSTGQPKGVIHSINTTIGFCKSVTNNLLKLQKNDVCYSIPKMFFGYGMGNSLFFPLYSGCSAIIDPEWPTRENILANISTYKPNVFFAAPAVYHMLRTHSDSVTSTINTAISAGACLSQEEFAFWKSAGLEICDGIGATEVGHIFLANKPSQAIAGTTGKILDGYECKLIDDDKQEITTFNTQGVLHVKGPSVSGGYYHNITKTNASFNNGWYCTNDLFTVDERGNYHYYGRKDDMFKIKGRWVTPAYIEQAICKKFPEIIEVALVPSCRIHDTAKPVLFYVSQYDLEDKINNFITHTFESHMRPGRLVKLSTLPRNDNAKVVRNKLVEQANIIMAADEVEACT